MAYPPSSRSKTETDTTHSEATTEVPLVADRWTNNISYRQLVASSCVGIIQFWWHPYVADMGKLLPFLLLYNIFSFIVGYPLLYLELALGIITKKSLLNCWDMAPMARGIGISMLLICAYSALALGIVAAYSFALLAHSFHSFLPWLHCAASEDSTGCSARHRTLLKGSETPAQAFLFNYVMELKRDGLSTGLGNIVSELSVYYVIGWLLIYFVAFKRIYSYSKLILFKDVITYFVLLSCAIGVTRLKGAGNMGRRADWTSLYDAQLWRESMEYALLETSVSHGALIMLGSYCPKQKHNLGKTVLLAFCLPKLCTVVSGLTLGAVHGALIHDYGNDTTIYSGSAASLVLWSDLVARVPGSQFWSMLVFFTMFLLALSSVALLLQTIMSTFTGRFVRKMTWAFLIIICILFSLIGLLTLCTEGGNHVLNFLMTWTVSKPRLVIAPVMAFVITYVYGQTLFCEDVYFAVGEYPPVYLRICWAITPGLLLGLFLTNLNIPSSTLSVVGWSQIAVITSPMIIFIILYLLFKCRVRNIVKEK